MSTTEQVRRELRLRGVTIKSWAVENGLKPAHVYAALEGKTKGNFGASHQVAVKLGLKSAEHSEAAPTDT